MKTLIIRDDDISFFTTPDLLERVYGRVWAAGIPVCFAVVPAPRGDTRVLHRPGQPLDPSIPPQYRERAERHPLTDNPELCAFLAAKIRQGLVEVSVHGYDHRYHEFASNDLLNISERLLAGHAILRAALPDAPLLSFIAPYDELSHAALNLLLGQGYTICTATRNLNGTPHAHLPALSHRRLATAQWLYTADDYYFHRHDPAQTCLDHARVDLQNHDFLIITNHYWTFFRDWSGETNDLFDAWQTFLDDLLMRDDLRYTTFERGLP